MSKLDQLRAQREAWASGKPKVVTEIPVTLIPPIKSNAGIKSNRMTSVASEVSRVAQLEATSAPGTKIHTDLAKLDAHVVTAAELKDIPPLTPSQLAGAVLHENGKPVRKRGRPAKPDGVTKDRAAYMRARRKKP